MKLTDEILNSIERKNKTYKRFDGNGLYVEIPASGHLRWRFRYTIAGKADTSVSLGVYPAISLEKARTQAAELAEWLEAGVDPLEYIKSIMPPKEPKASVNKPAKMNIKEARISFLEDRVACLEKQLSIVRQTIKDILYATTLPENPS